MCGVAGTLDLREGLPSSEALVTRMLNLLGHRGPDGAGIVVDPPVVLGHRRLAIIDLSEGGRQPMATPDGNLWLTYNGEIYNYLELGEELRARGYVPRSASDTEVLLDAYAEWGESALERLNGMFAFAIWDRRRRSLFCARDRFGIKPFYYTVAGGRFLFASEIKALLLDSAVPRRPNDARVLDFLVHAHADHTAETMFENIFQLEPGHWLRVDPSEPIPRPRAWYRARPASLDGVPPAEVVRTALTDSVSLRLRSDVPVGTCLSGGLDSSSVVTLTSRLRGDAGADPPDSFTARCLDPRRDETRYVNLVVEASGVRNHTVLPTDRDMGSVLDRILWQMDEPFHGPSVYGHWKVMELARRAGVTVLLDGQGGDEVFAGYHHFYPTFFLELVKHGRLVRTAAEARLRRDLHRVSLTESLAETLKATLPAGVRGRRHRPPWVRDDAVLPAQPFGDRGLTAQQIHGLTVSPLPSYLHHEDRNSMSFSLEARVPYLDYRVVEAGLALGPGDLLHNGRTKWALREAMRGIVPDEIVDRPDKQGFSVDAATWRQGELGREIVETLTSRSAAERPYFDGARLSAAAGNPVADEADPLWRSFVVERWLRVFFDGALEAPAASPGEPQAAPLREADVTRLEPLPHVALAG